MRLNALLVLLLLYSVQLNAQPDSLEKKLLTAKGAERFSILKQLIALDTSSKYISYRDQALELVKKNNDPSTEMDVWGAVGDHFINTHKYAEALKHYRKALLLSRLQKLLPRTVFYLDKCAASYQGMGDIESALNYYNEALYISQKLGLQQTSGLMEQIGFIYFDQQKFEEALIFFKDALTEDQRHNDSTGIAADLNNIGLTYFNRAQYDSSTCYLGYALQYYLARNDKQNIAQAILNIGINYKEQGLYDLGLEKILSAARYFEEAGDSARLASCYNTVGTIQVEMGLYDKALSYHFKALDIRQQIGNKRGIAGSLTNIGNVYKQQKKYDKALDYLLQSLKIKEELGDKMLLASTLDHLGEVYFLIGRDKDAEKFYLRSLSMKKEVDDRKGIALSCNKLGNLYMKLRRYTDAEHYLEEARALASASGAKDALLANYESTAHLYREQGRAAQALAFYDLFYALKDSIFNQQKNKVITEMQVKYETEHKEQEILLLSEKQKAQAALMQKQYITIYSLAGGTLLLIIIAFVSFKAYRSHKKANSQSQVIIHQKQELIEQKQLMMRELHHRVKNNLQLLSGLLSLQRNRVRETPAQQALQAVDHRLKAMLLIHRELYLDKSHDRVSIREYIQQLSDNLLSAFGYSKGKINIQLDVEDLVIDAEKALNLGLIINEAVSNSFKHAFAHVDHPMIQISLHSVEDGKLLLVIHDNGPGLPVNEAPNASFGLSLVEMLSREMKGTLRFSSNNGARMELKI